MAEYFYTEEELDDLKLLAKYYHLDAGVFDALPSSFLRKVCNGIGAERFSEVKRKALTAALKRYEVCAAIHDLDYALQVGKEKADKRFLDNMKRVWAKDYGFFRYFRPKARVERRVIIPAVYAAVALCGDAAYREAGEAVK